MAKLAVLFTVVFLLFTFSDARFISSETEQEVADLPKSDTESTNTIFLPTEGEHQKLLDFKHDDNVASDAANSESGTGSAVPLTKINFHPVNRHFPMRPLFPFRHFHHHRRHRNCRLNKRFWHLNPEFHQKRFVSYGNDMILSDERSFDPASRGVIRQIDARWGRFQDDGSESKHHVVFMKHHGHDHHEREHHDQEHEDHDHDDDEHDQEHDLRHEDEQEHHDEDHDNEHEDNHHKRHHQHHKRHHHEEEEDKDDTEKHEGLVDKFRKLFIHF